METLAIILSVLILMGSTYGFIRYEKRKKEAAVKNQEENTKEASWQKFEELREKYGESDALKLVNGEYWAGMTMEQIKEARGNPIKTTVEHTAKKTRTFWYYGNPKSPDVISFVNGKADKIIQHPENLPPVIIEKQAK